MFGSPNLEGLPKTIDQAADLLISDLLTDHIEAMASLSDEEFESLYQGVAPFLIDEFRLWSGNDSLLAACMEACQASGEVPDPVRIILKRVVERIGDTEGIIIIT
jgi:DNA topoisomerase IB